jgi:hypothetical protein
MGDLEKSVERDVGAIKNRAFSSFPDFLNHLIANGEVTSWDDLLHNRPDLLAQVIFRWYRQGQIACVFAKNLAHDAADANWRSRIVDAQFDPAQLNDWIDTEGISSDALQLIFPEVIKAMDVVRLMSALCATGRWWATRIPWKFKENGRSIQIGLRWDPPDHHYTSWALGIAPFEPMPFTRRFIQAPFTAIVFRPSPPTTFAKKVIDDHCQLEASHLAHMNDALGEKADLRKKIRKMTIQDKKALLGSDLWSTARAKVTFSLPLWCEDALNSFIVKPPPLWVRCGRQLRGTTSDFYNWAFPPSA